jgi:hypothetical protein
MMAAGLNALLPAAPTFLTVCVANMSAAFRGFVGFMSASTKA